MSSRLREWVHLGLRPHPMVVKQTRKFGDVKISRCGDEFAITHC